MPTYEYECSECGDRRDVFQSMSEKPVRRCPACSSRKYRRLIGAGAAVLFRGSGFFQTDYRSKSYSEGAKADSPAAGDGAAGCGKPACGTAGSDSGTCAPS